MVRLALRRGAGPSSDGTRSTQRSWHCRCCDPLRLLRLLTLDSVQLDALAITLLGCALIFRAKWSVLRTLGVCAVAGMLVSLATSLT